MEWPRALCCSMEMSRLAGPAAAAAAAVAAGRIPASGGGPVEL